MGVGAEDRDLQLVSRKIVGAAGSVQHSISKSRNISAQRPAGSVEARVMRRRASTNEL